MFSFSLPTSWDCSPTRDLFAMSSSDTSSIIILFFGTPCMCSYQKIKSHGGNLGGVLVSILLRDPGGHHVGVIDSVHLHNWPMRGWIYQSAHQRLAYISNLIHFNVSPWICHTCSSDCQTSCKKNSGKWPSIKSTNKTWENLIKIISYNLWGRAFLRGHFFGSQVLTLR